jgi:N-acetylglucosamine-6-phosphate deacetylase
MKLSSVLTCGAVLISSASAFTVLQPSLRVATQQHMFGGGGAAAPTEDDPEAMQKMEAAARSMGVRSQTFLATTEC